MTDPASQISLITVTFNSAQVLPTLLRTIPQGVEVIVVDNASSDDSGTIAQAHGARLIKMRFNSGFAVANNRGAAEATRPYLYFANPDSWLQSGCLETLFETAQRRPDVVALNPSFSLSDGRRQFKRRGPVLPRRYHMKPEAALTSGPVTILSGAGLLVARDLFEQLGGLDEQIFLYHDDDDLSRRLAPHGLLYLESDAKVVHDQGNATGRNPQVGFMKAFYQAQSKRYLLKKYGQGFGLWRLAAEALLKVLHPQNLMSRWRRAKTLGFIWGICRPHQPPAAAPLANCLTLEKVGQTRP